MEFFFLVWINTQLLCFNTSVTEPKYWRILFGPILSNQWESYKLFYCVVLNQILHAHSINHCARFSYAKVGMEIFFPAIQHVYQLVFDAYLAPYYCLHNLCIIYFIRALRRCNPIIVIIMTSSHSFFIIVHLTSNLLYLRKIENK